MVEGSRGDLRTLASGLFPAGFDAAALTPEGRDEVRAAVDVILRLSDSQSARLKLALEQLDLAAKEIDRLKDEFWRVHSRIDARLNDHLCEMREGYDDSITGFNEAWDIVGKVLRESCAAIRDKEPQT